MNIFYLRNIKTNELISEKIEDTSGNITFSLDDKYIFYSKLDKFLHFIHLFYENLDGNKKKITLKQNVNGGVEGEI